MGERKVLNKYFPPDFDPDKIPKRKGPKNNQYCIRMMLPMSIRCSSCGEYMYAGKKFNARQERAEGETYLGIYIYRFYMKCLQCSSEFTIKTDPKNSDYTVEHGAMRNYEPWRDEETDMLENRKKREEEEAGDAMKALENRTKDSKVEMDILDALDEIRAMNAKTSKMDTDELIELARQRAQQKKRAKEQALDEDDEYLVQQTFGDTARLLDEEEKVNIKRPAATKTSTQDKKKPKLLLPSIIMSKPKTDAGNTNVVHASSSSKGETGPMTDPKELSASVGLGGLAGLGDYGDSSSGSNSD